MSKIEKSDLVPPGLVPPGIIPGLMGGLGNQMFILAASYVASRSLNCPLYLPSKPSFQNPHATQPSDKDSVHQILDYIQGIFSSFGIHLTETEEELEEKTKDWKIYDLPGFQPWNVRQIQPGTWMRSYFQYYPPLASFETELRTLFTEGLRKATLTLKKGNMHIRKTAFLHIRRGDYLQLSHIHYVQPIEYYKKAVQRLLEENKNIKYILIFSDDLDWAKEQDFFRENPLFRFTNQEDNELEHLALMSLCTEGAICANSTFSWWGAFLGAYSVRNPVIVPSRWICDPIVSLFPPEWHVL